MTTLTYRANQGAHTTTITLEPDGSGWIRVEMLGTTERIVDAPLAIDPGVVERMDLSLRQALPELPAFADGPLVVTLGPQRRAMLEVDAPRSLQPFLREARDLVAMHGARGKRYTYTGHAARAGAEREPATSSAPDNGAMCVAVAVSGLVTFLVLLSELTWPALRASGDSAWLLAIAIIGMGLAAFMIAPALVAAFVNRSPTLRGMQTTYVAYAIMMLYYLVRMPGIVFASMIFGLVGGLAVVSILSSIGISLGEWLGKDDEAYA